MVLLRLPIRTSAGPSARRARKVGATGAFAVFALLAACDEEVRPTENEVFSSSTGSGGKPAEVGSPTGTSAPDVDASTTLANDGGLTLDAAADAAIQATSEAAAPPITCASAKAAGPQGKFSEAPADWPQVDAFARETTFVFDKPNLPKRYDRTFSLVFTKVANHCGYLAGGLETAQVHERAVTFTVRSTTAMPGPMGPGTYDLDALTEESGTRCVPAGDAAAAGSSLNALGLMGATLTIASRTPSRIVGTFNLNGTKGSFDVPLCPELSSAAACCAN